jgi:hypothetical protein|tara:strand:- start:40602 stop:41360 length:759 start_codon:yes stop_codon:yes gene_type:complete
MLNFFSKKPKLEFVSLMPEVAELMPIIPAREQNFKWTKSALDHYKKIKKETPEQDSFHHIAKCPGILNVMKQGWIHRSYQDIFVKIENDQFGWKTPIDQSKADVGHKWTWPYLGLHDKDIMGPYCLERGAYHSIVKIQTPWLVYVPKGYQLLITPLPYPDIHKFESTTGFLNGGEGPQFLNVQLFWYAHNEEVFIPKGTPLCQYHLIKKEEIEVEQRAYTENDLKNLRKRNNVVTSKFNKTYSDLRKITWKT